MSTDEDFMKRCIELAELGRGTVSPNPMVGAVVVHNGRIIGEGWHRKAGEPHAEVYAIHSVKDEFLLRESTVYVSLEPCSHFGKTPPCSDLLIEKRVRRVVIGCSDPNPEVGGKGINKMMAAGIDVKTKVCELACKAINERFFTFHQKKRPFITLKWAQTSDGFIDRERAHNDNGAFAISGKTARVWVHKQRTEHDAILIGSRTAEVDNPSLTARFYAGKSPTRLILDRHNKLPSTLKVFSDGLAKTIRFTQDQKAQATDNCVILPLEEDFISNVFYTCFMLGIQSIFVEGGATIHNTLLQNGLWDVAYVLESAQILQSGLSAPSISGQPEASELLGEDTLKAYQNVSAP